MTDNVFDPVIHHFVRYRNRLFRVTGVIVFYDFQLIALDTALGVNVGNCLSRTAELLVTVLRNRAGHRANNSNFNIFC